MLEETLPVSEIDTVFENATRKRRAEAARKPMNTQGVKGREHVLALRAKLKPISQVDADRINRVITEAREASIPHDFSA